MASFTVQKYHVPFSTLKQVAADTKYQLVVEPSNVIYTVLQVCPPSQAGPGVRPAGLTSAKGFNMSHLKFNFSLSDRGALQGPNFPEAPKNFSPARYHHKRKTRSMDECLSSAP